jgi:hypothetical protein
MAGALVRALGATFVGAARCVLPVGRREPLVERPAASAGETGDEERHRGPSRVWGQRPSARERCARSAAGLLAARWQERSGALRTDRSARCRGGAPLLLGSGAGAALRSGESAARLSLCSGDRGWKRRSASTAERRSLGRSGGGSGVLSAESERERRPARKGGAETSLRERRCLGAERSAGAVQRLSQRRRGGARRGRGGGGARRGGSRGRPSG